MFAEEPKARVIKRVAAFMYGNYVNVNDTVACYNACNGMLRRYVDSSLKRWYQAWDTDEGQEDEKYYSMALKRLVWLKTVNG
jgi:hypothetical protein